MKNLTLEHIAQACRGQYRGPEEKKDKEAAAIFTDSRKVQEGGLFVPIKGARADSLELVANTISTSLEIKRINLNILTFAK